MEPSGFLTQRHIRYYAYAWLKHDLPAGFTVFLVALPLCLGIALASGAPLYAGILSGVIGGLIVSLISGSHLSVSGPAAGLTALVSASIVSLGDFSTFLLAVIIAGLFQIILGVLKLGTLARYFPSSVIKGMLAAIGIILITKQIPLIIGYDQADFWTSEFPHLFSPTNFLGNMDNFRHHITAGVLLVSFTALLILTLWEHPALKKFKALPASLIVIITGLMVSILLAHTDFSIKGSQMVYIPPNIFSDITFPDFKDLFTNPRILTDGLLIGMLATLESLLCIEALDKMDPHKRVTPINREMIAQGVGNTLCGIFGAIPLTAVIVRGAANINAGARTRMSAFTHGVFLLFAVLFIPFVLNKIPYASLAAILLIVGLGLTKPALYKHMWHLGKKQFLPFLFTIVMVLATDLLIGVAVGLLVSIFFIIQRNFIIDYRLHKTTKEGIETYYVKLNTNVTFLNKVRLRETLEKVPPYSKLTVDGSESSFIDYDVLESISEFAQNAKNKHIELELIGLQTVDVSMTH